MAKPNDQSRAEADFDEAVAQAARRLAGELELPSTTSAAVKVARRAYRAAGRAICGDFASELVDEPMTEAQADYLRSLCAQAEVEFPSDATKRDASKLIRELEDESKSGAGALDDDARRGATAERCLRFERGDHRTRGTTAWLNTKPTTGY